MKKSLKISIIFGSVIIVIGLYFIPSPFSLTHQLVLSIIKPSLLQEFDDLQEVKLFKERYTVTRTLDSFNAFQSQFAEFYYVEPNDIMIPPMTHLVVVKDFVTGEINFLSVCFNKNHEDYGVQSSQILEYLEKYDCFKDSLTQESLDKAIPLE